MISQTTKAGKQIQIMTMEECRAAIAGKLLDSVADANAYLKRYAKALGGFAPYVNADTLWQWRAVKFDQDGRTPAQAAAAKGWGARMREGKAAKARRVAALEAEVAALKKELGRA